MPPPNLTGHCEDIFPFRLERVSASGIMTPSKAGVAGRRVVRWTRPQSPLSSEGVASMSKKIVIVDQDQQVVDEGSALLENIGYEVDATTGGEHAVALIRGQKPDLVIADAEMTVWDSKPIYELIQQDPELKDIQIIYLAPRKSIVALKEKLKVPTRHLMPKPWDIGDFIERVQSIVGEAY
ncbi:MAG: hypothetical protein COZ56_14025 [Armatimonadetes bacterium CG_4_8_14_3_um_filter_58_9]|nr:MAG: hypothetical protein COZ56_14025 [Armatimonadetes bacterium CG_4_8_14_3_um_filter_58_9]